jgi:hypothetical protein
LTVIVVSEWPSKSCRSRAIRLRSFSAASRATSARAASDVRLDDAEEAVHRECHEHDRQRGRNVDVGVPGQRRQEHHDKDHYADDVRHEPLHPGHGEYGEIDAEHERVLVGEERLDDRQRDRNSVNQPENAVVVVGPARPDRDDVGERERTDDGVTGYGGGTGRMGVHAGDGLGQVDQPDTGERPAPPPAHRHPPGRGNRRRFGGLGRAGSGLRSHDGNRAYVVQTRFVSRR